MCGIAGVISFDTKFILESSEVPAFTSPLNYRGPDGNGHWQCNSRFLQASLFHTRLSIIDLSDGGSQPMTNDSNDVAISFNGEIYNYQAIKHELTNKGIHFKSLSDTEVLLQGYLAWGIEALLSKVDGMFAFAIIDTRTGTLILARDRFGKKPLYYSCQGNSIVFSSDIRSFRAVRSLKLSIDIHALGYYFGEFGTPQERSIWKEVKKVRPAEYLTFVKSAVGKSELYWKLKYDESCELNTSEIVERTHDLLKQSVTKRLVADVNVSALLSGGIDSSLIVAKMAEASTRRVSTYSVGFSESKFNELEYSRKVAKTFDTLHTEVIITPTDFVDVDKLIAEFGEPFADSSMIPTYLISKEVAKSEKVVVGGDGGDELFAGYDSYYFAHKFDVVKRFGAAYPFVKWFSKVIPAYRTLFLERLLKQAQLPRYKLLNRNFTFDQQSLHQLMNSDEFFCAVEREHEAVWNQTNPGSQSDLINVLACSLKTRLLNDYLVKVDRASMYASLEMRSPYLDKDLAEFAATLKPQQILHRSEPKYILKQIALKHFGRDFVYRKKMGFGIPVGMWFKKELYRKLKEVVFTKQNLVPLNYEYIETLINDHVNGKYDHSDRLWTLYVFHVWANQQ